MSRVLIAIPMALLAVSCQQLLGIDEGRPGTGGASASGGGAQVGVGGAGASGGASEGGSAGGGGSLSFTLGSPERLYPNLARPVDLVVDETSVLWLQENGSEGYLGKAQKDGSGDLLYAVLTTQGGGLASDGEYVYWLAGDGSLTRMDAATLVPQSLGVTQQTSPYATAGAIAGDVFFAMEVTDGFVHYVAKDGSTSPLYADPACASYDMAASATGAQVYFPCNDDIRQAQPGSASTLITVNLSAMEGDVAGVAMGDDVLYFVTSGLGGRLGAVSLDSLDSQYLAEIPNGHRVAVDGVNAYVLTDTPVTRHAGLVVVDLVTRQSTTLLEPSLQHVGPQRIRVDDTGIYWINKGTINDGSIWRVPKY